VSKTIKIDGFTLTWDQAGIGCLILIVFFADFGKQQIIMIDKFVPPTEFILGDEFIAIADNLPEIEATLRI
jgi:hypothetical protein